MDKQEKVGILTFSNAYNYGAMLQAYALQSTIADLGHDTYIIRFVDPHLQTYENSLYFFRQKGMKKKLLFIAKTLLKPSETHKWKKKIRRLRRFAYSSFRFTEAYTPFTIAKSNDFIDTFVIGSDQVWNTKHYGYQPFYFGSFISPDKKLISYAASFGKESMTGYEYQLLKDNLPKYSALSIREKSGCRLLEKYLNAKAENVLDPTFLRKRDFWVNLASRSKLKIKKPYVLLFFVQEASNTVALAEKYAKEHNCMVLSLNTLKAKIKYRDVSDSSLEDFLWLIEHAECVFTTSFHGLALSINFNTNFYYELLHSPFNTNSRLIDLCSSLGILGREITDKLSGKEIDWKDVNAKLEPLRQASIDYLIKSL